MSAIVRIGRRVAQAIQTAGASPAPAVRSGEWAGVRLCNQGTSSRATVGIRRRFLGCDLPHDILLDEE